MNDAYEHGPHRPSVCVDAEGGHFEHH